MKIISYFFEISKCLLCHYLVFNIFTVISTMYHCAVVLQKKYLVKYHSSFEWNFSSLYFKLALIRKEKKPAGGGTRCLQCPIEEKCPYSAKKIYLDPAPTKPRWPMSPVCDIEDGPGGYLANLTKAIETGLINDCDILCVKNR